MCIYLFDDQYSFKLNTLKLGRRKESKTSYKIKGVNVLFLFGLNGNICGLMMCE